MKILNVLKSTFVAMGCMAATLAQAHWVPSGGSDTFTATVSANGSSFSYSEADAYYPPPLVNLGIKLLNANAVLEAGLNARLREQATAAGLTYLGGSVSGDLTVSIQPVNGVLQATLSGLSFRGTTRFTGKKWGVISYDCVNVATINNIVIRAQYGAGNGAVIVPTVGVTGETGSSTECDSNLSWMLPFVGDLLINYAANKIDDKVLASVSQLMASTQGALLYGSDVNLTSSGLLAMIPANAQVGGFAIGSYVRSNLSYLLANSQFTFKLGHGVQIGTWRLNSPPPETNVYSGDVMNMTLTVPGVSFNVNLKQSRSDVEWLWVCNVDNLNIQCPQP